MGTSSRICRRRRPSHREFRDDLRGICRDLGRRRIDRHSLMDQRPGRGPLDLARGRPRVFPSRGTGPPRDFIDPCTLYRGWSARGAGLGKSDSPLSHPAPARKPGGMGRDRCGAGDDPRALGPGVHPVLCRGQEDFAANPALGTGGRGDRLPPDRRDRARHRRGLRGDAEQGRNPHRRCR